MFFPLTIEISQPSLHLILSLIYKLGNNTTMFAC